MPFNTSMAACYQWTRKFLESVKARHFWTYVSGEPFHLFRYLDEQTFRFNNRKDMNDGQRFQLAMSKTGGKRLTSPN